MIRISHWDDESKAAAPVRTHSNLRWTTSTYRLVSAVDVCSNFDEVDKQAWNVPDHFLADVFQLERDVLCSTAQGKPQRRSSAGPLCSSTEDETLRHWRLSAFAIRRGVS